MTDQDPTQGFEPPTGVPTTPPAPPVAPSFEAPPTPPAAPAAAGFAAPEVPGPLPVATSPVEATPSVPRPGRSKLKWLVAAVVVLLVAGTAAGATLLLTSDSGDPAVLAYAPADSVMYAEARLDLPGDQSAELAKVMKAFPGFEDQAAFPTKLSEALDQLVGKATDGKQSWKNDIEPWFGGQVAVSVGKLPTAADAASVRAALLIGVKDADKAATWAGKLLTDSGATSTTESYGGTTITVVTPPASSTTMGDTKGAYATVGPILVFGDLASVKAIIDTNGKTGLPTNAQFKQANASVAGDRLGFVYVDSRTLLNALIEMVPQDASMPQLPASLLDQMPAWTVETIRAKDSSLVMDVRMPHADLNGKPAESKLPGLVPASTVVLIDGHDLGASLKQMKDLYGGIDAYKDAVKQIDDALSILGGFDAATGWMGESGIAISRTGDTVTGGILVVPTDRAGADRLFNQLKAFIQLGGAQAGLKVSDEDYKGTPITVIDLSGLSGLAGSMAPGVAVPADLKLAYAVTDEVVVLGYGTDFVKAVLDARTGDSLAKDPRFADALARVGTKHTGLMWVDVAGIRDLVEGLLPSDARSTYETDVKPYLDAFNSLIEASVPGTPYDSGSIILHVTGD